MSLMCIKLFQYTLMAQIEKERERGRGGEKEGEREEREGERERVVGIYCIQL